MTLKNESRDISGPRLKSREPRLWLLTARHVLSPLDGGRKLGRFAVERGSLVRQLRQLNVHHEFGVGSTTVFQRTVE